MRSRISCERNRQSKENNLSCCPFIPVPQREHKSHSGAFTALHRGHCHITNRPRSESLPNDCDHCAAGKDSPFETKLPAFPCIGWFIEFYVRLHFIDIGKCIVSYRSTSFPETPNNRPNHSTNYRDAEFPVHPFHRRVG